MLITFLSNETISLDSLSLNPSATILGQSNIKIYIDGDLKATNGTNTSNYGKPSKGI